MDSKLFVATAISALLQFKWKYDADLQEQEIDFSLMTPEKRQAAVGIPTEMEFEAWFETFCRSAQGPELAKAMMGVTPDIECFASTMRDEPTFTLLGRDVFASILVKHWAELARGLNPENIRMRKLDNAIAIADAMEEFEPQKLPD